MAKKETTGKKKENNPNVVGLSAQVIDQQITETLEINYMP